MKINRASSSAEYNLIVFSRHNRAIVHVTSQWLRQHKTCARSSQTTSPYGRKGRQEVQPLAKKLLMIDSYSEEPLFSLGCGPWCTDHELDDGHKPKSTWEAQSF